MKRLIYLLSIFTILISCHKDNNSEKLILLESPMISNSNAIENHSEVSNSFSYSVMVTSSEGGSASFIEDSSLSLSEYSAKAIPNEGFFFDRWEIFSGTSTDSLFSSSLKLKSDNRGINLRAYFLPLIGTLFVVPDSTVSGNGSKRTPYGSLLLAINDANKRIESGRISRVTIRVALGSYYISGHNALELVSGLSIIGGYNPITWQRVQLDSSEELLEGALSKIVSTSSFSPDAMLFITSVDSLDALSSSVEPIIIDSLFFDGLKSSSSIISSSQSFLIVRNSILRGRGNSLITVFDSGLTVENSLLNSFGNGSIAINVELASSPGISITKNKIVVGSKYYGTKNGNGIYVYSSDSLNIQRVNITGNYIISNVISNFEGIIVKNGVLICEKNRVESGSGSKSSIGLNIKGEAVVNRNTVILDSDKGFGLSFEGNSSSSRILNNTIVTKSSNAAGRMTACGIINGDDLLIRNNIFVNPSNESAAALGVDILNGTSKVYNNSVISNNREENSRIIGHNGNISTLPDRVTGASISENCVEVEPEKLP